MSRLTVSHYRLNVRRKDKKNIDKEKNMAFILNPYDATLNLADRDGQKLIENGYKGLKAEYTFDGQKENYTEFVILIEEYLENTRVMCAFEVAAV